MAKAFQDMISFAKEQKRGEEADNDEFLEEMHIFGVMYTCVGILIFIGGYLGSALMNITAINQVFEPLFSLHAMIGYMVGVMQTNTYANDKKVQESSLSVYHDYFLLELSKVFEHIIIWRETIYLITFRKNMKIDF